MRVAGDPDGCAALSRELWRAAVQVEGGSCDEGIGVPLVQWSGVAATRQQAQAGRRRRRALRLADRLGAASYALAGFAERLLDLQAEADRLAAVAAEEGLVMTGTGDVLPVPVPAPTVSDPAALAAERRSQHLTEVRHLLLLQVAEVRAVEDELHRALARRLQDIGSLLAVPTLSSSSGVLVEQPGPNRWAADAWDLPAVLEAVPTTPLSQLPASGLRSVGKVGAVLRSAPGVGVLSAGLGVAGDVDKGYTVEGAVTKQTALATASLAAGSAAGAAASMLAAPVVVVGAVGIGVAAGVGYAGSRVYDAAFGPEPPPPPRREYRRAVRPAGAPLVTRTCGGGPFHRSSSARGFSFVHP